MAAVEVTISGVLFDKTARTSQPVVIIGEASLTGLGVGGGPIIPPEAGQPPSIWPSPGHPAHPIAPGGPPPHVEHPIPPYPAHPIVLPPEGSTPPTEPPVEPPSSPPSSNWEWGYNPNTGWIPVYVPGDKPQPPPA